MDRKGGLRFGERLELFLLRHGRGAAGGPRQDDGLRNLRDRQLSPERSGGGREGRDAGGERVGDAQGIETAVCSPSALQIERSPE